MRKWGDFQTWLVWITDVDIHAHEMFDEDWSHTSKNTLSTENHLSYNYKSIFFLFENDYAYIKNEYSYHIFQSI